MRSAAIPFWSAVVAVRGASSPQTSWTRRSVGNDLPGAQEQRREEGTLPQAAERQRAVVSDDLERAEQPELEHGAFVPLAANRCLTPRARERLVAGP